SSTFTATASGTGSNPTFAWFVNGNLQSGFSSATFSFVPNSGDRVTATMTPGGSGTTCILGGTATSNGISLQVAPYQQVSLSIASSSTQLCSGTGITFTATGTNAGNAPIFTWWVNNQAQSTGDQFSYLPSNGDFVQAMVLAGGVMPACLSNSSATSSGISLTVDPCLKPQVTSITGPAFVSTGSSNITYSVPNVPGDTYQWTVPAGATITSGQGTNSITVDFGNSSSGQITLTQTNANGSTQVQQSVTIGTAPAITTITGPTTVTEGSTGITYSVTSVPGTSYQWTVPTGATITSGQGTSSITVDFGSSVTGFITLNSTNTFGTTTTNLSVQTAPVTGVEEKAAALNIELFPNPSEKSFTFQAPEGMVQIMDIHGVQIEKWNHRGISTFGEFYPAGVYLIQWQNQAGVIKTSRLVKLR
ncbi:MAG: hypothetical protein K2Q22_00680, partial [Cytophagales bacterium]|nr:hypothetical protein [Cytophagales bacterium]